VKSHHSDPGRLGYFHGTLFVPLILIGGAIGINLSQIKASLRTPTAGPTGSMVLQHGRRTRAECSNA
jgi:hypothetical protein